MRIADCGLRNKKSRIYSVPNRKGLTLLEMAISMAILAIGLVALANLFPIGLKFSRRASTFSQAGILAQRVIDNIKIAASIYDDGDDGDFSGTISDVDYIGYFGLANPNVNAWPFDDSGLTVTAEPLDANGYRTYLFQYDDTDMTAHVKSVDWDANGVGNVNTDRLFAPVDWDDVLLSQKVYVAIYWTEADRDRAETFIIYIANPFYEKYK